MVIWLERGVDLHTAQLMPLPFTVSCFSEIQIGFIFLVPTYAGSHGKKPLNWCYITDGWTPYCYIDPALDISVPTIIQSQDVSIVSNTHMQYDAFHHATLIRHVADHCHR